MSTENTLTAQARDRVGKGAARELRRNEMVPAVIYGDKKPPLAIALPYREVNKQIQTGHFMTSLLTIDVDGEAHRVLPKDYQLDPVRDFPIHVDLLRISRTTVVTVEIPVLFENEEECRGLKAGGVLNVVRHEVEVECPAEEIPESFTIDLLEYEIGDAIHVSAIDMPDRVTPTITDRDFTIATIATPAALRSDEEEEDDTEAPEASEVPSEHGGPAEGEEDGDGEGKE